MIDGDKILGLYSLCLSFICLAQVVFFIAIFGPTIFNEIDGRLDDIDDE